MNYDKGDEPRDFDAGAGVLSVYESLPRLIRRIVRDELRPLVELTEEIRTGLLRPKVEQPPVLALDTTAQSTVGDADRDRPG